MSNEIELVAYEKLRHVKVFLNRIAYRNYHQHRAFELLYVLEGSGQLNLRRTSIPLASGSLVILNPQDPHEIDGAGNTILALIVQVSPHFCQEYLPLFRNLRFLEQDLTGLGESAPELYRSLRAQILETARYYLQAEPGFELGCISALAALFRALMGGVPNAYLSERDRAAIRKRISRISRMTEYLEEHYLEPVRLRDLAELEGITETHVSHLFTDYYGISFQAYLSNLRFEKAMTYLRTGQLSQAEVAAASGFSDPKYLSQAMHNRLGCSLGEYRRQLTHIPIQPLPSEGSGILEYVYSETAAAQILRVHPAANP